MLLKLSLVIWQQLRRLQRHRPFPCALAHTTTRNQFPLFTDHFTALYLQHHLCQAHKYLWIYNGWISIMARAAAFASTKGNVNTSPSLRKQLGTHYAASLETSSRLKTSWTPLWPLLFTPAWNRWAIEAEMLVNRRQDLKIIPNQLEYSARRRISSRCVCRFIPVCVFCIIS